MTLRATGLGFTYGEGAAFAVDAIDGVDVTLEPGRLLLVAGPTGSGKSTLLRLLAGLLPPSRGDLDIDGEAPEAAAKEASRRVGLLFQRAESQLFAESVLADVAFGPSNLGEPDPDAAARSALETVGLDPAAFGGRSPFTLSGGEARRVALAGVLAMSPAYLLLDEPTAGLDAHGRRVVREVLDRVRGIAGVAVVTHDTEEYLDLADDVLLLDHGRPTFSGTVERFADAAAAGEPGVPVPQTIALQAIARGRGLALAEIEREPAAVARSLARAGGWTV